MVMIFKEIQKLCYKHKYDNAFEDVMLMLKNEGWDDKQQQEYVAEVWNYETYEKIYGTSAVDFLICQIRREIYAEIQKTG